VAWVGRNRLRAFLERALLTLGRRVPVLRGVVADALTARDAFRFVAPGHFYSPMPSREDIELHAERMAEARPRTLPGIALNEDGQLALLEQLKVFYPDLPFSPHKTPARRYFYENSAYSYSDAICLFSMIRHTRPRRIIEVGSGYSSCVILDTNEVFFDNRIACTFVEPYPQHLRSLMKPGDEDRVELVSAGVQTVDLDRFRTLEENDILFIDSTHVVKLASDVHYIVNEILPILPRGVYVHIHDIFYPFEYPAAWLRDGRMWNEAYILRAFLSFNSAYEIVLFNTFLEYFHRERFAQGMPLCLQNEGGSIWLRSV
jgi:hypothetical protein